MKKVTLRQAFLGRWHADTSVCFAQEFGQERRLDFATGKRRPKSHGQLQYPKNLKGDKSRLTFLDRDSREKRNSLLVDGEVARSTLREARDGSSHGQADDTPIPGERPAGADQAYDVPSLLEGFGHSKPRPRLARKRLRRLSDRRATTAISTEGIWGNFNTLLKRLYLPRMKTRPPNPTTN